MILSGDVAHTTPTIRQYIYFVISILFLLAMRKIGLKKLPAQLIKSKQPVLEHDLTDPKH